jgi:membrane protease YdiL (CAAX protease family)
VILLTGVFRPGSIRGRGERLADLPVVPVLVVAFLGGGAWLFTQVAYGAVRAEQFSAEHPHGTFGVEQFGAVDFAFLSTVPAAVGLLILLTGDTAVRGVRTLGYSLDRLPLGAVVGAVAALAVLPLMWWGSIALDVIYRWLHFQHPSEHELLGAMKGASRGVRAVLVIGACVAAPVFEELLFRGHIQTILARMFSPSRPRPSFPVVPPPAPMVQ